jgi:protein TonB
VSQLPTHAPAPSNPVPVKPQIVVPGGRVKLARCIFQPQPEYPQLARAARISGTVQLEGIITVDGHIRSLTVLSGHPLLVRAAVEAVKRWIYEPTTLNGEPVEVRAPITVTFQMK